MSIPFSPRAMLCTAAVLGGMAALASARLPGGLGGLVGLHRESGVPTPGASGAAPDVQREILETVLSYEARRPGTDLVCIKLAAEGATFASEQRAIAALERELAAGTLSRPDNAARLDGLRNPARPWLVPAEPAAGAPPQPVSAEAARQLRSTETMLLTMPTRGRIDIELNMGELPVRFQSTLASCKPLTFTAPAIAGDLAFVEISFRPTPAVQEERLYAVVLREGRWELEALAEEPVQTGS